MLWLNNPLKNTSILFYAAICTIALIWFFVVYFYKGFEYVLIYDVKYKEDVILGDKEVLFSYGFALVLAALLYWILSFRQKQALLKAAYDLSPLKELHQIVVGEKGVQINAGDILQFFPWDAIVGWKGDKNGQFLLTRHCSVIPIPTKILNEIPGHEAMIAFIRERVACSSRG